MIVISVYGGLIKSFMLGCMLKTFYKVLFLQSFMDITWIWSKYWKSNAFIGQDFWQGCFWGTTTNYPFMIILA
jgi:hypothetical protein